MTVADPPDEVIEEFAKQLDQYQDDLVAAMLKHMGIKSPANKSVASLPQSREAEPDTSK